MQPVNRVTLSGRVVGVTSIYEETGLPALNIIVSVTNNQNFTLLISNVKMIEFRKRNIETIKEGDFILIKGMLENQIIGQIMSTFIVLNSLINFGQKK